MASSVVALSQYGHAFPSVESKLVLLSCKQFETQVRLTPFAATIKGFEESVASAKEAIRYIQDSYTAAMIQRGPLFYGGSNIVGYFTLSYRCYHSGQHALRQAIQSVILASSSLDSTADQIASLGGDELLESALAEISEADDAIERMDASSDPLGGSFVKALNATEHAAKSQITINHAVKLLLDQGGLLEKIFIQNSKLLKSRQEAIKKMDEMETQTGEAQREAARLQEELTREKLFLIPENAFSLQQTKYADSSLSYEFPEKWDKANALLSESLFNSKEAQKLRSKDSGYMNKALSLWRKSLSQALESSALFNSAKSETQSLERALVTKITSLRKKAAQKTAEQLDDPLPRLLGERVIELSRRLALLETPPDLKFEDHLSSLYSLLDRAEKDGVDVGQERSEAKRLQDAQEVRALASAVEEKTLQKYAYLETLYAGLLQFEEIVSLPHSAFSENTLRSDAIGSLKETEKQLGSAKKEAGKKTQDALRKALADSLSYAVSAGEVFLDSPVREEITLTLENMFGFGGSNVIVPLPTELDGVVIRSAQEGVSLVEKGLRLSAVAPYSQYEIQLERERVLARTIKRVDYELFSDFEQSRRRLEVSFEAESSFPVLVEEKLAFPPDDVSPYAQVAGDTLRSSVRGLKGQNSFAFEYSVRSPVDFRRELSSNSSVTYHFKNRLPVELKLFKASLIEAFDCAAEGLAALGGKAYLAEFSFPLKQGETKSVVVQLSCKPSSTMPEVPLSSSSSPLFLRQAASWAQYAPESAEWLKEAEDAFDHLDSARYSLAVEKLESLQKSFSKSLDAKASSLCSKCSQQVRSLVQEARSAVFVSDFSGADQLLQQASSLQQQEQQQADEDARQKEELLQSVRSLSVPQLSAFEAAFSMGKTGSPYYEEANEAYKSAKKIVADLQKEKPVAQMQESLRVLGEEQQQLDAALEKAKGGAEAALETARLAQKQFGDPASQLSLDEAENAFGGGLYSKAEAAARKVTSSLQNATTLKPQTGLFSKPAEVGLGILAALAIAGLFYYFRYHKPPGPVEEL